MRNIPEANRPAIYKPVKLGVFKGQKVGHVWVIKQTNATPYMQNGLFMRSSLAQPIYGYTKNYTKFKKDYSLFIWTTESDTEKVEAFLDSIKTKREDIIEVLNKIRAYKYVEPVLL